MNCEVKWPRPLRQRIETFGFSQTDLIGVVETLDRALLATSSHCGVITQEMFLPCGDYYAWVRFERVDQFVVVNDFDIQKLG